MAYIGIRLWLGIGLVVGLGLGIGLGRVVRIRQAIYWHGVKWSSPKTCLYDGGMSAFLAPYITNSWSALGSYLRQVLDLIGVQQQFLQRLSIAKKLVWHHNQITVSLVDIVHLTITLPQRHTIHRGAVTNRLAWSSRRTISKRNRVTQLRALCYTKILIETQKINIYSPPPRTEIGDVINSCVLSRTGKFIHVSKDTLRPSTGVPFLLNSQ